MKTLKYLLCGITMCALACSSSKDDGDGPGKGASNTLKVMSFNVRYNSANDEGDKNWEVRKAAVVKMINTVQPDVVGLQEPRTGTADLPEEQPPELCLYGGSRNG